MVKTTLSMQSPFRSDCLKGKVALVTGGGSGICFEITRQLLLHGCKGTSGENVGGRRRLTSAVGSDGVAGIARYS